uniref:Secreted protein n=1 Tax=Peronospora matthiolae TaxID=2874970 RepID=A0AAV1V373_9STRA
MDTLGWLWCGLIQLCAAVLRLGFGYVLGLSEQTRGGERVVSGCTTDDTNVKRIEDVAIEGRTRRSRLYRLCRTQVDLTSIVDHVLGFMTSRRRHFEAIKNAARFRFNAVSSCGRLQCTQSGERFDPPATTVQQDARRLRAWS